MEKIIVKPDKDGKLVVVFFGTPYEIVIDKKGKEEADKGADEIAE